MGIDINSAHDRYPHAEIVATVDLRSGRRLLTGKSYPSLQQEKTLIRCIDLDSHFQNIGGYRVAVFGCHDLMIYSPRSVASTKKPARKKVQTRYRALAKSFAPQLLLHHPHTVDTPVTWRQSWNAAEQTLLPLGLQLSASAVCYLPQREAEGIT